MLNTKRSLFVLTVLLAQSFCLAEETFHEYLQLLQKHPKNFGLSGSFSNGEIEIIKDPAKMREIEKTTGRKVGIVAKDRYWIWVNDAVKFPNGKDGVYGRILSSKILEGSAGVAVMPVLPDGKIALNRNFRHATRSWEYELPRGAMDPNESIEAAAKREVKEETGMVLDELHSLGEMAVDSGLTNAVVPIILARVSKQEAATPDDSEAIEAVEAFSVKEIKEGYKKGYLTISKNGKTEKIPLRDPFLAYALLQAEIRNLLK
jgi:ADP-ribose pyrophosphatase